MPKGSGTTARAHAGEKNPAGRNYAQSHWTPRPAFRAVRKHESAITTDEIKWLNKQPFTKAIKTHGSNYGLMGTPDILCTILGRFVAIEYKKPGNTPTEGQEAQLKEWHAAGAAIAVCYSHADVMSVWSQVITQMQEVLGIREGDTDAPLDDAPQGTGPEDSQRTV